MTVLLVGLLSPLLAGASSHREAPLIAEDPLADGTDLYAFVSPNRPDTVTIVANYVPFQNPAGGPNFYRFGDDLLYEIHVDNVGDARSHVTFTFKFDTSTVDPGSFLYNTGPITFSNGQFVNWNRPQTYTVALSVAGTTTNLGTNLLTPPDNVGPASFPGNSYHAVARNAIHTLPAGIKVFAGQRDDPFFADLGHVFDLLSVVSTGEDYLAGINVNSIVLQVPKTILQGPNGNQVVGIWTNSSRRKVTVLNGDGTKSYQGGLVQVSRLGMPLVNEVVIPLGQKDLFNATKVSPTSDGQFLSDVQNSYLATLLVALGIDSQAPTTNRQDLVITFLEGIPGLNQQPTVTASEMLRLNMATPVSSNPNRLGVIGGDPQGFPNGRRLADDVVDISLQVVDGILCEPGGALTPIVGQCRSTTVNPALGDGVNANEVPFQSTFPYLADPHAP